jgi:hypothetical protein
MGTISSSLWNSNLPRNFWCFQPDLPDEIWSEAIKKALPLLGLSETMAIESVLEWTLGEGQFGSDHYELGLTHHLYYRLKPSIPRALTRPMRQVYHHVQEKDGHLSWPVEPRFAQFQWEITRQLLLLSGSKQLAFKNFWPGTNRFAFVLTHDIETAAGQEFAETVADLEEDLGFRSSFNFIPEKYPVDHKLMQNLQKRGFEVGVHGLKHDGRLLDTKIRFMQNASRINKYLKEWNAVGFRAELTLRQPEWMQALEIEYDLSFFDTDPFEPIPGGTMSIWPFFIGHFVELPYTLVQDYTLISVLCKDCPQIWLEKVDFIEKNHGMALVNTHPDYLKRKPDWDVYCQFLNSMKTRAGYWQALPVDIARWWKSRVASSVENGESGVHLANVILDGNSIKIEV